MSAAGHRPWHLGSHPRLAREMNRLANANPHTICMGGCTCHARTLDQCTCHQACGRTLTQHPPTRTGPPIWTAGHRWDSRNAASLAEYRHEVRGCGSAAGNRTRFPTSRAW